MNPTLPVEDRILGILTDLTAVAGAEIRPSDRLREDLGMDSVASMELLSMLSEQLEIDVEMEEAMQIETVEQVQKLVRERYRG